MTPKLTLMNAVINESHHSNSTAIRDKNTAYWLSNSKCPDCMSPLTYNQCRLSLWQRIIDGFTLDQEAKCSCGFHVIDRETFHWWSHYDILASKHGTFSISIDDTKEGTGV